MDHRDKTPPEGQYCMRLSSNTALVLRVPAEGLREPSATYPGNSSPSDQGSWVCNLEIGNLEIGLLVVVVVVVPVDAAVLPTGTRL